MYTHCTCTIQVDRDTARLNGDVENEIFDLFASLDATDEQLDFPIIYASAKYVSFSLFNGGERSCKLVNGSFHGVSCVSSVISINKCSRVYTFLAPKF